ncbi:TolC family protein [Chitinophagaceae bacterium LWZ2-11]
MNKCIVFLVCVLCFVRIGFGQQKDLNFYVDQALLNSPLLKDYKNQVETNKLDSQRIKATYLPQVNATSLNTYSPVIAGYGYDNAITNGANVSALVGVNKTFVSKRNLNTQFESLHLLNEGLKNTAQMSEQDIKRTVVAQYIIAYGDLQQLNFNKEINKQLIKGENTLKALTEKNVYRQTDYLTYVVTLQQQELTIEQLEIQYQNDYATLNYVCGITDTTTLPVVEPYISLSNLPDTSSSVFFKQFTIDSLKLINSKTLVDFNYKPKINIFGDAGYNSSLSYQAYKNFGTSIGVSLTVPIYDGKQRNIQYSKIAIQERTRTNYKDFFKKQYSQQVAQLMQQLGAVNRLLGQINKQIKYSETLVNANGKLMETGDVRIADYIIAINNYLTAKNLLTQNNITRLQIINQINYWNR